jgi:hypothetical protein
VAVSLIAGGTILYRRQMAAERAAPPVVAADTVAPPAAPDTSFDVNNGPQPATVHRRAVGVDTALLGGRMPNIGQEMPAYIRIVTRGGAARVRVDGTMYGFTPLVIKVDAGTHYVSLESSGDAFLPAQLTIDAVSNDTVQALFTANTSK